MKTRTIPAANFSIMRNLLLLSSILFFPSCTSPPKSPPPSPPSPSSPSTLSINDFKEVPEEIEGCTCLFSETEEKSENNEYVFAANYDSVAYVSVNHRFIKLKLISSGREPDTFGDYDHTDIYASENYKVTVDIHYKNQNGDETWWNDGTIRIENKNGEKLEKKFVGECGC